MDGEHLLTVLKLHYLKILIHEDDTDETISFQNIDPHENGRYSNEVYIGTFQNSTIMKNFT